MVFKFFKKQITAKTDGYEFVIEAGRQMWFFNYIFPLSHRVCILILCSSLRSNSQPAFTIGCLQDSMTNLPKLADGLFKTTKDLIDQFKIWSDALI